MPGKIRLKDRVRGPGSRPLPEPLAISPRTAAELADASIDWIWRGVRSGLFKSTKVNGKRLLDYPNFKRVLAGEVTEPAE